MMSRVRWASLAVLAVLALVSPCLAANGAAPGRAGIGGQLGGSFFIADQDYSAGAEPRLDFQGHFRYVFSTSWRAHVGVGYTWTGYSGSEPPPMTDPQFPADTNKGEYLTQLIPVQLQIQYTRPIGTWLGHVGVGGGAYRVWVQNHEEVLKDPVTLKPHQGVYPGMSAELGAEMFFKALPSTSLEFATTGHWVFAQRDEQFPSGFNSFLAAIGLRVGANYYFDPNHKEKPAATTPAPPK